MAKGECPFTGDMKKACQSGEYGECLLLYFAQAEHTISSIEKEPQIIKESLGKAHAMVESLKTGAYSQDPYLGQILETYEQTIANYKSQLD
jgi:hypothetical protein